jgi:hypothetical protein
LTLWHRERLLSGASVGGAAAAAARRTRARLRCGRSRLTRLYTPAARLLCTLALVAAAFNARAVRSSSLNTCAA